MFLKVRKNIELISLLLGVFFILTSSISAKDIQFKSLDIKLSNKFIKQTIKVNNNIYIATANGITVYDIRKKKSKIYLKGSYISSLAVDSNEKVLWAGTPKGLILFTIHTKKRKKFNKRNSKLSDDRINALLLSKTQLFIGTNLGVDVYNIKAGRWKAYTAIDGLAGDNIRFLILDGSNVWAGGNDGLSFFNSRDDLWLSYGVDNGLNNEKITCLALGNRAVWVGTDGGGISKFDKETERYYTFTSDDIGGLVGDTVQTLIDDGQYLWVGTFDGLSRLNKIKQVFQNYVKKDGLKEESIRAGVVIGNELYIGSEGDGLYVANKEVPEVSFSQTLSKYNKKGRIEIVATLYSQSNIDDVKVLIRALNKEDADWISTGIKVLKKKNTSNKALATIDDKDLADGGYSISVKVTDNDGKENRTYGKIIVDKKKPEVEVFVKTPRPGQKEISIRGKYKEDNLEDLSVYIGKRKLPARNIEIDRIQKRFRFNYKVGSSSKIKIVVKDIGQNVTSIEKSVIADTKPPKIIVNKTDLKNIENNSVKITGTIIEENLDTVRGVSLFYLTRYKAKIKQVNRKKYTFEAEIPINSAQMKILITAYDLNNRRTTVKLNLVPKSKVSILIFSDGLPSFTLRKYVKIKGNLIGPSLKEFYVNPGKIPVTVHKNNFIVTIPLKDGSNDLTFVWVDENDNRKEKSFQVKHSIKDVKATLNIEKRSYKEKKIVLKGKFDRGVSSVYIGRKQVKLNQKTKTFSYEYMLKNGKNEIKLTSIDELNRKKIVKNIIILDNIPPKVYVRTLPYQTGLKVLKFKGKITDASNYKLSVFPSAALKRLNPETGEFEGSIELKKGSNRVFFKVVDSAGNVSEKEFVLQHHPDYPKIEVSRSAGNNKVLMSLREEIDRLRKLLSQKGGSVVVSQSILRKSRLPKIAGIFSVPFLGRNKSYRKASEMYLGNQEWGSIIASFNHKNIRRLKKIIVPSPQLFQLLNNTKSSSIYIKLMQKSARTFSYTSKVRSIQKSILRYLMRRKLLKSIKTKGGVIVFIMKNNSAFTISKGRKKVSKSIKAKYHLRELISVKVYSKALLFQRI